MSDKAACVICGSFDFLNYGKRCFPCSQRESIQRCEWALSEAEMNLAQAKEATVEEELP